MKNKVLKLLDRFSELEHALAQPDAYNDQKRYREITQEHSYLADIKQLWELIQKNHRQLTEDKELLKSETDADFCAMLKDEISHIENELPQLESKLENLLVPPDPNDHRNVIIELRAGTGGDEAALFVGDCVRMYQFYAAKNSWKYELLSCTESEKGGYREYIMVMSGHNVNRLMQYEAGTHRVQRVPETEAQGRVHTSAITVAVLLEPGEEEELDISEKDLRIDTYRSSGAGGQHVNTTDSAVRITHIPTGIVVYCQQERSQHKNRDKAMRLLQAKMADEERRKKDEATASTRAQQVGSGDRSERIRTYNFPQNRVTDHRINLTLYNLDHVMDGELSAITEALVKHFHQEKLAT